MDADSQSESFDYLKLKVKVLPDRIRQINCVSIGDFGRLGKATTDWLRVQELGSGGNGVVWLEMANSGAVRAVKLFQKSKSMSSYLQELLAMTKLSTVTDISLRGLRAP